MYKNPLEAYQEVGKSTMSGREVEAYALTKVAMAFKDCQDQWETPKRDDLLENAIRLSNRVWSIFQAELTRADNAMPRSIKQNILKLSVYIDTRLIKILATPKREALNIIISINENMAAGLRQTVAGEKNADISTPGPNLVVDKNNALTP